MVPIFLPAASHLEASVFWVAVIFGVRPYLQHSYISYGYFDEPTSCLIPRFDGAIYSLEWKEALWDKYVTAAPRTV
ncbi:MAG: hypothetical protein COA47_15945, partial [Robiginitomaculum sp.]